MVYGSIAKFLFLNSTAFTFGSLHLAIFLFPYLPYLPFW